MSRWYTRDGQPSAVPTLCGDNAVVQEDVGDYFVSTVFLGLNHNWGDGPPLLFETMVFKGSYSDLYCDRYATEDEARAGHADVVEKLKAGTLELYGE